MYSRKIDFTKYSRDFLERTIRMKSSYDVSRETMSAFLNGVLSVFDVSLFDVDSLIETGYEQLARQEAERMNG